MTAGVLVGEDEAGSRTIGLAITKEVVDLLKGSIRVVSKANAGTVFEVTLPIDASN